MLFKGKIEHISISYKMCHFNISSSYLDSNKVLIYTPIHTNHGQNKRRKTQILLRDPYFLGPKLLI